MPKMKTSRAAAKRFKVTGSGKLVRNKAYKSHILTKKISEEKKKSAQADRCGRHQRKEHEEDFTVFIRDKEDFKRWQESRAV